MGSWSLHTLKRGGCISVSDKLIHIPGRKLEKLKPGQQPVIRLTPEAYDALMEITNESSLSVKMVASEIILQSRDCIVFDRAKEE